MKFLKGFVKFSFALLGFICIMSAMSAIISALNISSDSDEYYDCT